MAYRCCEVARVAGVWEIKNRPSGRFCLGAFFGLSLETAGAEVNTIDFLQVWFLSRECFNIGVAASSGLFGAFVADSAALRHMNN